MKPMKARLWLPLASVWGVVLVSRSNSARLRMQDVRIVIHSEQQTSSRTLGCVTFL